MKKRVIYSLVALFFFSALAAPLQAGSTDWQANRTLIQTSRMMPVAGKISEFTVTFREESGAAYANKVIDDLWITSNHEEQWVEVAGHQLSVNLPTSGRTQVPAFTTDENGRIIVRTTADVERQIILSLWKNNNIYIGNANMKFEAPEGDDVYNPRATSVRAMGNHTEIGSRETTIRIIFTTQSGNRYQGESVDNLYVTSSRGEEVLRIGAKEVFIDKEKTYYSVPEITLNNGIGLLYLSSDIPGPVNVYFYKKDGDVFRIIGRAYQIFEEPEEPELNEPEVEPKAFPPGLSRNGNLPPGLSKKDTLPPGLAGRAID